MGWAEGIVTDAPTGNGIFNATVYDYIDGYWGVNNVGWYATPNGFPGMTITGSALGHNPRSVQLSNSSIANDPAVGTVFWNIIALDRAASTGGGSTGGGCFIATAAYGSELAPEVRFLQNIRDNVLRQTRWGRRFFDELWQHYYRISPPIAKEMWADPKLREVVSWSIVEPWTNYMKLLMARPALEDEDLNRLEPGLRKFLGGLRDDMNGWLKQIEVPQSFRGQDPADSVRELNLVLGLVLKGSAGRRYLEDLRARGELPVFHSAIQRPALAQMLAAGGRSREEIDMILAAEAEQ
uniref:Uncharacterized protein n=1 Tax=Solibacter usitatus (strain Ellin6076) TaxID=234267 RepID=Q01Z13_SOLUE